MQMHESQLLYDVLVYIIHVFVAGSTHEPILEQAGAGARPVCTR